MTILAATDLSEASRSALRYGHAFARALGQPLSVVSVAELWERDTRRLVESFEDDRVTARPEAIETVQAFVDDTLGSDAGANVEVLVDHPPAAAIIEAAARLDAQLIVVGTSGHSRIGELFFGSTTSAVARESTLPVLAVPPQAEPDRLDTILAPVDLSPCSARSLGLAHQLAQAFAARLIVLHASPVTTPAVSPPMVYIPEATDEVRRAAEKRVHEMVVREGLEDRADVRVEVSPPHAAILHTVEDEHADLIVMGTHARSGVEKFFLGSTAERVLRDRTCPVIVLRGE